jgi:hypothetical protein
MIDPKQHADHRGWIESILRYVPGFRGYLEAEYRRESDYLTRVYMLNRLAQCRNNINSYQELLVNSGNLDDLTQCERVISDLTTLGNKMAGDVQGYSGMFDFVQIKTAELDRLYDHDIALLTDVAAFEKATASMLNSREATANLATDLRKQVATIETKYAERSNILQGLHESAT